MQNICEALFDPADELSVHAAAALTGKRFVTVTSAGLQSGPGLADTSEGGNIVVNYPTAGSRPSGVLQYDLAINEKGSIFCGHQVVPVTVGAAPVANGVEVEVDAAGRVITLASGVAVGRAIKGAAAAADAFIKLYS